MTALLVLKEVRVCRETDADSGSARLRLSAAGLETIACNFGDALHVEVREAGDLVSRSTLANVAYYLDMRSESRACLKLFACATATSSLLPALLADAEQFLTTQIPRKAAVTSVALVVCARSLRVQESASQLRHVTAVSHGNTLLPWKIASSCVIGAGRVDWQWTFLCVASVHTEQLGAPALPAPAPALLDPSVQLPGPGPEPYPDPASLRGASARPLQARVRPERRRVAAAALLRVRAEVPAPALRALLQQRVVAPRCRVFLGVRRCAAAFERVGRYRQYCC